MYATWNDHDKASRVLASRQTTTRVLAVEKLAIDVVGTLLRVVALARPRC